MINDILGSKTLIPLLKRILDLGAVRHRVIAQNIANASTVGYRKKSVEFEDSLQSMIDGSIGMTDGMVQQEEFKIVESSKKPDVGAPNNVDLSQEMADLAKNQLYYKFAVNLMKRQFNSIKSSISGRSL
ncbi:MAG: flagellar basal body rod protein FlgB [Candidatus Marinimicrobia bacterium]|nr:flagellar basal body rod protein FlgB [Candidatus Neomarinimicrobiota bacterium]